MESIEKLRESSHLDDSKWTLETGEVIHVYGSEPNDPNAVNWGEQWRKIADEIEAEIAERYMELPVDADGVPIRCGDEVTADTLGNGKWSVFAVASDYWVDVDGYTHKPYATHHVNPRTIEDVLRDVWNEALDYAKSDIWRNPDKVFVERAAEIRELMEVDR